MKRGQIFVRAWAEKGDRKMIVNCDVLDLTQESLNVFLIGMMFRAGMLTGLKDEFVEGEPLPLFVRQDLAGQYINKKENE